MLSGGNRRPSSRSQVSDLNGIKEDRDQNPGVLRKRTTSLMEGPTGLPSGALKAGQSVLEQIGQPDHNGWMMKKGERYNTWKLRYFVLKGPHLYSLESNSKTVSLMIRHWNAWPANFPLVNEDQGIHRYHWIQGHRRRECEPRAIWIPIDSGEYEDTLLQFRRTNHCPRVDEGIDEGYHWTRLFEYGSCASYLHCIC